MTNYRFILVVCAFILNALSSFSQTKKDIEKRIERTKYEIEQTSNLIKETELSKKQSYTKLELISKKIDLRKEFISALNAEVSFLSLQLIKTQQQVDVLSTEIRDLKAEYTKLICYAYMNRSAYDRLMFILSSEDFNQAYKRIKYLQFYSEYRRLQVQQIISKTKELNTIILSYNETIKKKESVMANKQHETELLADEQNQKSKEISMLESRQRELKDDLQKKLAIAEKLKNEIARIIAEEQRAIEEKRKAAALAAAKKAAAAKLAASKAAANNKSTGAKTVAVAAPVAVVKTNDVILSGKFSDNLGNLPWPTANGVVTQTFGEHQHPMFPSIKINNNGVDISCSKGTKAFAIFEGEVSKIIIIPGANSAVLVRHGNFVTVYSNLSTVYVKQGQKVTSKQPIGIIYSDEETGKTTLNFQVWKETTKLDPQKCLRH